MSKLYPPAIEGTIPAFYGTILPVPFVMNKTVSWSQVDGMYILIKSIQNNSTIYSGITSSDNIDKNNLIARFAIPEGTLKSGLSYKIQLAYATGTVAGYYSTVGVVKYTQEPEVYIEGLTKGNLSSNNGTYVGVYSQEGKDVTEKVYSYNFTVYDQSGAVFDTTGNLIHNHESDSEIYESIDTYEINKTLEENVVYTIQYTVTTTNGLVIPSPRYRIIQQTTVEPEIKADVTVAMNEENGYVNVSLLGHKDDNNQEVTAAGVFLIARSSSKDGFRDWVDVDRFALFGERPSTYQFKDFTVEHGYDYQYSIQQYNKEYGIYSNRMISNIITASFEHSFLYDGERQLKIKFNPKVTSFKDTLLESKTNTLGGKYPYFYRNGNVKYKEFPISGLISYHSDEEQLFLTDEEMLLENSNHKREHTLRPDISGDDWEYFNNLAQEFDANYAFALQEEYKKRDRASSPENLISRGKFRTTSLTDYNIVAERTFKLKVLEFLNDGKPKLFRSPGEGNYLVRLMNSSLSPEDKLSRMIHTFNTTATEIDDFNYRKLGEYNLTHIEEPNTNQLRWKTFDLRDFIISKNLPTDSTRPSFVSLGNQNNIYSIQFLDMMPGDQFRITFDTLETPTTYVIGVTGAYFAQFDEPIVNLEISTAIQQGQITFSTKGEQMLQFDTYKQIEISDYPIRQFIGPQAEDIKLQMEDIKNNVIKYYFLNFTKRPILSVTQSDDGYLINGNTYTTGMDLSDLDPLSIYLYSGKYYDGSTGFVEADPIEDYNCKIYIDGKEVDIADTNDFLLMKPENGTPVITFGSGVVADVSVQRRQIVYDVEAPREAYTGEYKDIQSKVDYEEAYYKLWCFIRNATLDDNGKIIDNLTLEDKLYQAGLDYSNELKQLEQKYIAGNINEQEYGELKQQIGNYYEELITTYREQIKNFNFDSDAYENQLNILKQDVDTKYQIYLNDIEKALKEKGVVV